MTFAARDFWARRGASDAHTLQGSVRSEQRRLGQKEPPPGGVASLFGSGFVTPRSQPHFGGCSLVAPRQNRKSTQQTSSYLRIGVLRAARVTTAPSNGARTPQRGVPTDISRMGRDI